MFEFTYRHLVDKISSDITWTTVKQSRVNAELVSLARALNGDKETMFLSTERSKKIEVTYGQLQTH
jgi:hypothetical protein